MPDPAEIIAATMLRPPVRPDTGVHRSRVQDDTETGLEWQYRAAMGLPGAPELTCRIGEAAIEALGEAGWVLVRAPGVAAARSADPLPSLGQVRSWLALHEWKQGTEEGPAGALWFPPVRGRGVGIPHDGDDPDLITGAIERIAGRMSMSAEQVLAEMMLYG